MSGLRKKIYYHVTDCGGVVYYSNYLKYFEEARTEFFLEKGIDIRELAKKGTLFAVKGVVIDYKAPASYGDNIIILTELNSIRNASMEFSQQVKVEDKLLVLAKTQLVCVDNNFRPKVIPAESLKCLKE